MGSARALAFVALALAAGLAALGAGAWLRRDDGGSRDARSGIAETEGLVGASQVTPPDLRAPYASESRSAAASLSTPIPKPERGASLFPAFDSVDGAAFVLRMRVLDPTGAAVSSDVSWRLVGQAPWRSIKDSGRTSPAIGAIAIGTNAVTDRMYELTLHLSAPPNLAAEVALPVAELSEEKGEFDVGEVRLSPLDLITAGHVVLPNGKPVTNATVVTRFVDADGERIGSSEQTIYTGTDGAFRFFGRKPDRATTATVEAKCMIASSGPPLAVAFGETGVLLELHSVGRIGVTVLHDLDPWPANLFVVAEPSAGARPELEPVRALVSLGGEVELAGIFPGRYDVLVVAAGGEPLARVVGVEVRDLEVARPAALNPLDLRGVLRPFHLEIVNERGEVVAARIDYRTAGDEGARWSSFEGYASSLVTMADELDLVVSRSGCETVRAFGAGRGTRIVMRPGFPVAIALATELPLCWADVQALDEDGTLLAESRNEQADRATLLTLARSGRLTIRVRLSCRSATDAQLGAELLERLERWDGSEDLDADLNALYRSESIEFTREIDVLDTRERQRFVLTVPADVPRERSADEAR